MHNKFFQNITTSHCLTVNYLPYLLKHLPIQQICIHLHIHIHIWSRLAWFRQCVYLAFLLYKLHDSTFRTFHTQPMKFPLISLNQVVFLIRKLNTFHYPFTPLSYLDLNLLSSDYRWIPILWILSIFIFSFC